MFCFQTHVYTLVYVQCVIFLYLVHAVVQGHGRHVFDVLAVLNASQFDQQVVPLSVIDPNLGETQRRHQLLPQKHLHTHLLLTHLDGGKDGDI